MTTAVITKRPVEGNLDIAEFDREFEIEVSWMLWGDEPDSVAAQFEIEQAWKLPELLRELNELATMPYSRRDNPAAQAMQRNGRRYKVRKDHGTKIFYKEIVDANALREEDKPSEHSVRGYRKARKHAARSGHPCYKATPRG